MATAIALPVVAPVPVRVGTPPGVVNVKVPATESSSATPVAAPVTVPPEVYAVYEAVLSTDPWKITVNVVDSGVVLTT
jgi:hypothetical protein